MSLRLRWQALLLLPPLFGLLLQPVNDASLAWLAGLVAQAGHFLALVAGACALQTPWPALRLAGLAWLAAALLGLGSAWPAWSGAGAWLQAGAGALAAGALACSALTRPPTWRRACTRAGLLALSLLFGLQVLPALVPWPAPLTIHLVLQAAQGLLQLAALLMLELPRRRQRTGGLPREITTPLACAALAALLGQAGLLAAAGWHACMPTALLYTLLAAVYGASAALGARDLARAASARRPLLGELDTLRRLCASQRDTHESERRHAARLLHDELGQLLCVAANETALLQRALGSGGPASGATAEALARLDDALAPAIACTRRIASELRPRALDDGGLHASLAELARQFSRRHGIACQLRAREADLQLPAAVAQSLYRIVEEALDNVQRHAHAHTVEVVLRRVEGELRLAVQDDGRGLPAGGARARSGLADLRERVQALHGSMRMSSPAGARLEVSLPLDAHGGAQ